MGEALAQGDTDRTIGIAESVLAAHNNAPEAVYLLGLVAARMDEPARTLELMKIAHDLAPHCREFADALAIAYAKLGRLGDSLFFGKLAAALQPHETIIGLLPEWFGTFEQAFLNISEPPYAQMGDELLSLGNVDKAVEMYRRAAEAKEEDPEVWRSYAARLVDLGRVVPALQALRKVSELNGETPVDEARIASCFGRLGRFEEMRAVHDAMLAEGRVSERALSTMLDDIRRDPACERDYLVRAERIYAETFPPAEDSDLPSRAIEKGALKIGLVSSRFSLRGGLDFLWPLLTSYGFKRTLIYVYANDLVEDSIAKRVQGAITSWLDTREIDDLTLDAIIRNDGIHLLIDLDGHLPGGRPQLFQRRPAQAAIRLAGLPESAADQGFDAVLGDAALYPPDEDARADGVSILRVEGGLFRLPMLKGAEEAADGEAPDAEAAPTLALSLTQAQLSEPVVDALAAACQAHPELRLLIPADMIGGALAAGEVESVFAGTAAAGRIDFTPEGVTPALRALERASATLQLGPCWAAGVAAALSRGRPVVASRGMLPSTRMSDSLLTAMGLEDFLVDDPVAAVGEAAALAADPEARRTARKQLAEAREQAQATDFIAGWGDALAATLEGAYRDLTAKGEGA